MGTTESSKRDILRKRTSFLNTNFDNMKLLSILSSLAVAYNENVFGNNLSICSTDPMTGWTRDGTCKLYGNDRGTHTTCAQLTTEFLEFSKSRGNDLMTPRSWGFPGLREGDKWCLCALRWNEAYRAYKNGEISANGVPGLVLDATHRKTAALVDGGMKTVMKWAVNEKTNDL